MAWYDGVDENRLWCDQRGWNEFRAHDEVVPEARQRQRPPAHESVQGVRNDTIRRILDGVAEHIRNGPSCAHLEAVDDRASCVETPPHVRLVGDGHAREGLEPAIRRTVSGWPSVFRAFTHGPAWAAYTTGTTGVDSTE